MQQKSTQELMRILNRTKPEAFETYIQENADELFPQEKPFAEYMRMVLKKKHRVRLQDVFTKADFSYRYGYRLMSEEKRTRQRDYILKICLAGGLTLEETQIALQLYGMSQLYVRLPRDAVLIMAFQNQIYEIPEVNKLLIRQNLNPLKSSGAKD